MDTKLKNYSAGRLWICLFSGIVFIATGTLLVQEAYHIFWLYDVQHFLNWAPVELNIDLLTEEDIAVLSEMLSESWKMALIYFAVALLTLIVAIWLTGMKINWFDRIFAEVQLILLTLAVTGLVGTGVIHVDRILHTDWFQTLLTNLGYGEKAQEQLLSLYGSPSTFEPQWLEDFFAYVATAVLLGLCLMIVLSWVKKLKARCFWRHTLVGGLFIGISDVIRDSREVQVKVIGLLLIGALLSATWIGLIAVAAFIIFFVPKQVKKYLAIRDGVEEVKKGNLDYKIPVTATGNKSGELDRLAESINEISAATSIAVANELKNQRMKTDLISNVSHDLKTPLTSMVSYVDLLKSEGLDGGHASEYLGIIDEKTKRLQKLTEDLLEAAKASSGDIPVNMEKIEMSSIAGQALAEVETRLDAADLDVIFQAKTEDTFVMADGQLLWRVMENLLVNVGKYALPGSRVYLDVMDRGDGFLLMEMKNMSKDRLNIDADELMERFKRGDDSRNTEGSGLGLAIAKDLVKLMEGEFDITVDGDLFKVSIALKKAEGPAA